MRTEPQGATVTRLAVDTPIRISLWWNGQPERPTVELTSQAAVNLAIDLLLAARHGMNND